MIEIINEVAVLGCTLLMMAVATVWYSNDVFGKVLAFPSSQSTSLKQLLLMGASYGLAIALLAYGEVSVFRLGITPLMFASYAALFASAVLAGVMLIEGKPWKFCLVHLGFVWLFIIGSVLIVHHWPW